MREHLAWHERHQGYLEEKRRLAKEWRQGRRQLEHEEAVSEKRDLFATKSEKTYRKILSRKKSENKKKRENEAPLATMPELKTK